ncbi:hypothetical protein DPO11_26325 [Salmonella enterica]|nr:hypothetical protein [Salmonella enterica]
MATGNVNNKSQMKNIRFPHDVIHDMEALRRDDESTAGFIVTAVRVEIARRRAGGSGENPLISSLDALERVEAIGIKAADDIGQLVSVAREELQRRKPKEQE